MSARNIALTGVPRGGTTLACRLLGTSPGTVSLFEPMEVMDIPARTRGDAVDAVDAFFRGTRESLMSAGRAPSKQSAGRVPDNPFGEPDAHGRRAALVQPGWITLDAPPSPGFTLAVKHNAAFAALLPELASRFETFAIVRNPIAVLASWYSLELPVSRGRIPAGERFDLQLAARLDATSDLVARQVIVLDWFFDRFERHLPPRAVITYERMVESGGHSLSAAVDLQPGQHPALESRNANPLYRSERLAPAIDAVLRTRGAWLRWYPQSELEAAAAVLMDVSR